MYGYDPHGRRSTETDARNGNTSYGYNNADLVASVTTPNPGTGGGAQTTLTFYNAMSQATNVVLPDGASVMSAYLPTGELQTNYGARVYPAAYTYHYAGPGENDENVDELHRQLGNGNHHVEL